MALPRVLELGDLSGLSPKEIEKVRDLVERSNITGNNILEREVIPNIARYGLHVKDTGTEAGLGIFTTEKIPKDEIISVVVAHVTTQGSGRYLYHLQKDVFGIDKTIFFDGKHRLDDFENRAVNANFINNDCTRANSFSQIVPGKALIVTITSREIRAGEQIKIAYGRGYFDDDDATLEKILIKEEADRKGDTSVGPVRHCICKGDYCFYGRSFID